MKALNTLIISLKVIELIDILISRNSQQMTLLFVANKQQQIDKRICEQKRL
jgi:hypothetical protein